MTTNWDLNRFVKTLAYFGTIPIVSSIDWLQQLLGSRTDPKVDFKPQKMNVILVVGATGGVGKRVVQRLQQTGYAVRALVRDKAKAAALVSEGSKADRIDVIEADITIPATLTAVMQNVSAIVCCSGTKVQPVEGDTPTREKYYQGIKFYLPEVVDTPELVEFEGVRNLVEAARAAIGSSVLFDFRQPSPELGEVWGALDDVVMGGVSQSGFSWASASALFSGTVSTQNSGGFASVRSRNFDPAIDLSAFAGIELRVKGDGLRYKFMLRSETRWDGVAYCYSFDTVADEWITVRIPFADLTPVFRAKTVREAGSIDASQIHSIQLMLSKFEYDGALNPHFTAGFFQLQIESIAAYRDPNLPQFILVSSAGVTRPGRSDLNLEEEPPAVRMNDQLGGILTWKLRGEEVVRSSGLPYTIIRPCALTEEAGGQRLIFEQGDTLKGKVSREDIASLCVAALQLPQASNATIEVAEGTGSCKAGDWPCLFASVSQPDSIAG